MNLLSTQEPAKCAAVISHVSPMIQLHLPLIYFGMTKPKLSFSLQIIKSNLESWGCAVWKQQKLECIYNGQHITHKVIQHLNGADGGELMGESGARRAASLLFKMGANQNFFIWVLLMYIPLCWSILSPKKFYIFIALYLKSLIFARKVSLHLFCSFC